MSKKTVRLQSGATSPEMISNQTVGKSKEDAQPYERIKSLEEALSSLSRDLINKQTEIVKNHVSLKDEVKNFKQEVGGDKIRAIEIIGIFIALFTFASLEISILQKVDSGWKLFSLSFIVFSGLLFFAWLNFLIAEKWLNKDRPKQTTPKEYFFPLFAVSLLIIGGILWWFSSSEQAITSKQKDINTKIDLLQNRIENIERKTVPKQ
jgi:hypothetical protein